MRASGICGSDVRAIWREHLGTGAEAYRNVIAGHEPCGDVAAVGPDTHLQVGDRVVVYHISGCGGCGECRHGYMISCTGDGRAAYGWQRDGGHAEYMLAEARDCIRLPDELTHVDGALVACGFGTAYEALLQSGCSGRDTVLVTGLGPVGLAAGLLARRLGAHRIVGVDAAAERCDLALTIGAVDAALGVDEATVRRVLDAGRVPSGFELGIDCSGATNARGLVVGALRRRGRAVMVGEGGR